MSAKISKLKIFCPASDYGGKILFEIFKRCPQGIISVSEEAKPFFELCKSPRDANWILIPAFISALTSLEGRKLIRNASDLAKDLKIPLGVFSNSDTIVNPGVDSAFIFTPGAYSYLPRLIELPAVIPCDPIQKFHSGIWEPLRLSDNLPRIGFCGQATLHPLKLIKDWILLRKLKMDSKKPEATYLYVPQFLPAFERGRLLNKIKNSKLVRTDFVFRTHYRGGANTEIEKLKVEREFFENINRNLFTICLRGMGNYSVRFYQTLAMGRIPVLIDSDSVLPFADQIPYEEFIVRVPYHHRFIADQYVQQFLMGKSPEHLVYIQQQARQIWLTYFRTEGMLQALAVEMKKLAIHGLRT